MLTLCVEQNIVKLSSMNEQPEKKNRKARSYRWTSHVSASMVLSSPTGNNQRYEQIFIGSRMMRAMFSALHNEPHQQSGKTRVRFVC